MKKSQSAGLFLCGYSQFAGPVSTSFEGSKNTGVVFERPHIRFRLRQGNGDME
jgi:hypothetical protein